MEDLKNGMEDRLPYFHTNYIYSIYQNLPQITKYYQTRMRIISHFSVLQCKFLACSDWLYCSFANHQYMFTSMQERI